MANSYYTPGGVPSTGSAGSSAVIRGQYELIEDGFDKMPALTANTHIVVNAGGTALTNLTTAALAALLAASTFTIDDASASSVTNCLTVTHTTSGTPAAGIGTGIAFITETSASNNETGMLLQAVVTDATATSEDFDFVIKLMTAGAAAAEKFRVTSTGNVVPGSNDGGSIGISGTAYSDLFLASGGVISWNAGNSTITHSAGVLTVATTTMAYGATAQTGSGSLTYTGGGSLTGTWSNLGTVTTVDINGGTIDGTTQATGTINGSIAVGGAWTAAATWTLPAITLGGTVTSNGQSFSGTIANLGTVTTADINGGTVDGAVIGGASAAAGTFTTLTGTTSGVFASDITITSGSIVSASGAITFSNENLSTTGTLASGALTVTGTASTTTGVTLASSSGNVGIGIAHGSADGKLHVYAGNANATASGSFNTIVAENSSAGGMSVLALDNITSGYAIGSPSSGVGANWTWNFNSTSMVFGTNVFGGTITITTGPGVTCATLSGTVGSELATFAGNVTLSEGKLSITDTANEIALAATSSATTANAADITASSLTSGSGQRVYSNSADTGTRSILDTINDNASATGAYCLRMQQDAANAFVNFVGTAGANATDPISTFVTVAGTLAGWAQVDINGAKRWMPFYNDPVS